VTPGLVAIEIPHANRMRDIVEHGGPLWESVVAESATLVRQQHARAARQLRRLAADVQDEVVVLGSGELLENRLRDAVPGVGRMKASLDTGIASRCRCPDPSPQRRS
jgi:hypothetical protein